MKPYKIILLILLTATIFSSCVGDLDFDQTQDFAINPVAKIDLVYFKINKTTFDSHVTVVFFPNYSTSIQIFNSDLISGNIDHATLKFEIENTFDIKFDLEYHLIDEGDNTLEIIPLGVSENSIFTKNINYSKDTPEYENLINTRKILVVTKKNPLGADLSTADDDMFLHFKSAIDLFLIIDDV